MLLLFWPSECGAFSSDHSIDPDPQAAYMVCGTPLGFHRTWVWDSSSPSHAGHVAPDWGSFFGQAIGGSLLAALAGYLVAEWRRDHFEQLLTPRSGVG
jgi:hypothetical protein